MFHAIRKIFVKTSHFRSVVLTRPTPQTFMQLYWDTDLRIFVWSTQWTERGEAIVRSLVNHVKPVIPLPSFCGLQSGCHLAGSLQSARLTELIKYLWNCLLLNSRVVLHRWQYRALTLSSNPLLLIIFNSTLTRTALGCEKGKSSKKLL